MSSTMLLTRPSAEVRIERLVQPGPGPRRHWMPGWSEAAMCIRGLEHLVVLMTTLSPDNEHAGVTDEVTGAWAQVKRLGDRWWVEGCGPSEDWPGVFVPEAWLDAPGRRPINDHACWSHTTAAELIWAFLDGRAIAGAIRLPAPGGDHA